MKPGDLVARSLDEYRAKQSGKYWRQVSDYASCIVCGKVPFDSERQAEQAMQSLASATYSRGTSRLNAYKCRSGDWHIGRA